MKIVVNWGHVRNVKDLRRFKEFCGTFSSSNIAVVLLVLLLALFLSLLDGLVFTIEASPATGKRSPAPEYDANEEPVRRWTMDMKSLAENAWMVLGEHE